jgi:hypothetical protein
MGLFKFIIFLNLVISFQQQEKKKNSIANIYGLSFPVYNQNLKKRKKESAFNHSLLR